MRPYKIVVDYDAVEFFQGLNKNEQRFLHAQLFHLRDYPHNSADRSETGEGGRVHFIYVRGKFAIKYWIDEAAKEVRVLDIHPVRFTERARSLPCASS